MRSVVLASLLVSSLAACGGGGAAKPTEPPKATKWRDMNADQRIAYMKEVVLPESKKIFVAFDAKKFENMDCNTCHGDGAENGSFEMPDAKIHPLPNSEEAFMAWAQKEPEVGKWAQFMSGEVEPLMARLLDETVFDPKTKTGEFGCTACHTLVDAEGKPVPLPPKDHDHDHHDAK